LEIIIFEKAVLDIDTSWGGGYAWSHRDGAKDERKRFMTLLEIPPVVSAETAVRVQVLKDVKEIK
jgi:hypothetical protein